QVPPYPSVAFTPSEKATTLALLVEERVMAENRGLIRSLGRFNSCKPSIRLCVEAGEALVHRARREVGIGPGVEPAPPAYLEAAKAELEKAQVILERFREEEAIWDKEERELLKLASPKEQGGAGAVEKAQEHQSNGGAG
ncbi:unnamed protein product, partial [Discosporangium mesarthrocarpum]